MASIYKRGPWWHIRYQIAGREIRKSLKTKSAAEAKRKLAQLRARIELGELRLTGEASVLEAASEFIQGQERIRAPQTAKAQERHLEAFLAHCGVKRIGQVAPRHVTAWLNSLNVANATRNQARASIHRFFEWAMKEAGLADRNPAAMTTRAREVVRPREYLTAEERDRILEAVARTELELPIALGALAGLRREEIVRLEWRDVDLGGDGMVTVRDAKSRRPRSIPLHRRLRELLERQQRRTGRVCWNGRAHWTLDGLSGQLRKLGRSLGLKKLRGTHILRHTFGSLLAQAGESPQNIKEWMGHSSLIVTQRYMHLAPGRRGKIDEV